jgi:hypothetical protein
LAVFGRQLAGIVIIVFERPSPPDAAPQVQIDIAHQAVFVERNGVQHIAGLEQVARC